MSPPLPGRRSRPRGSGPALRRSTRGPALRAKGSLGPDDRPLETPARPLRAVRWSSPWRAWSRSPARWSRAARADILPRPAPSGKAKRYDKAEIHYQRALQMDARTRRSTRNWPRCYAEWPARPRPRSRPSWVAARRLAESRQVRQNLEGARRRRLRDGQTTTTPQAVRWAKKLLELDPRNADAHSSWRRHSRPTELDHLSPTPEIKRTCRAGGGQGPAPRRDWVSPAGRGPSDPTGCTSLSGRDRALSLPGRRDRGRPHLCRLRALDVETTTSRDARRSREGPSRPRPRCCGAAGRTGSPGSADRPA